MPRIRNFTGVSKGERQFLNYDFTSVLTGQSYVNYYGMYVGTNAYVSGALLYPAVLRTESPSSGWTSVTTAGTTTYNFDAAVEKTNVIEGTAIAKFKYTYVLQSGTMTLTARVLLQRVRDGVVTDITNTHAKDTTATGTVIDTVKLTAVKTTVIKGDTLRLSVSFQRSAPGPGSTSLTIYHDPEGTTDEDINVSVPFIPDI